MDDSTLIARAERIATRLTLAAHEVGTCANIAPMTWTMALMRRELRRDSCRKRLAAFVKLNEKAQRRGELRLVDEV